jgi:L-ascorbate metabolism protein UlaG (beta-lactamase superfamily)
VGLRSAVVAGFGCALAIAVGPAHADGLSVRWLGVAGFAISDGETTLLHDPYLSRPGLWETLFSWYRPDAEVLAPLLEPGSPAPELGRGTLILVGHSHFDHLGDVPWIAARTGAVVAGSRTTVAIAQGYGLPAEQTRQIDPGDALSEGPFTIRTVESRHARIFFGRPPLVGVVEEPPETPIHALSFKLGDARGYLVTHRPTGLRIFLLSSAGVHVPALEALAARGLRVDLLLAAIQGRDASFTRTLVTHLRPRVVIPHHFDDFFRPLDDPGAGEPSDPADVDAFEAEVRAAAEAEGLAVTVARLGLFETYTLGAAEAN